jgi:hypothetical protein
MLVLKRKEGQWIEIIHRSGDVIRVRVYDIQSVTGTPSRANLAFDDSARNFEIRRPERRMTAPAAIPAPVADGDHAGPVAGDVAEDMAVVAAEAAVGIGLEAGADPGSNDHELN